MREGDSREGIKKRGEDLEGGLFLLGEKIWKEGGDWKEKIVLRDFYLGTIVAGDFGLEGQETTRIPGTRELETLFLAD